MGSERMRCVRPFNGFPSKTDAEKGFTIRFCSECGERIFVPFNQLGERPEVCRDCYL